MFGIGTGEILLILVITMMVVGPERMVELSGQIGRLIAKFRQETDSVTQEFREAFALESGEKDEEGEGESPAAEAGADAGQQTDLPEGAVDEAERTEEESAPMPPRVSAFADGEIEPAMAVAESADGATEDDVDPLELEPVIVQVATLVPEDEDVEPTVIEQPLLVPDPDEADDTSESEG